MQVLKDYYRILQVSPHAEREVIDAAYRRLARKYHPDIYTEPDAAERMRELNEAYEVLGDPGKRAQHDRARDRRASERGRPTSKQKAQPPERVETAGIRRRGRRVVVIGVAIFLLALVAAGAAIGAVIGLSGGGDDEEALQSTIVPGPGATGTATGAPSATPSAVDEQLQGMVLQPDDVPAGFSLASESFSTNEEVAGEGEDAAEVLAQLTEWGRIRGHGVVFSSGTSEAGVLLVDSTVSLYASDSGAAASFADAVDTARATDWQANVSEATDVSVEEIPPLDGVGDEMLWLRMNGKAVFGDPATEKSFVQDVVLLRVGRARGSVSIVSAVADVALQVEGLVRTQAAHMAEGEQ